MAKPFRRAQAPVAGAVTLVLSRSGDAVLGEVKLADGKLFSTTGALPVAEAFGIAVHVANEGDLEIVVIDPQDTWKPNWGTLVAT